MAFGPLVAALLAWAFVPAVREETRAGVGLLLEADLPGLQAWAERFGIAAPLATFVLMVVQALAAPIPAVLVTWTNSLLFGPFLGGVWSIVSATFAASLCFFLARACGASLIARLVPARTLERTDAFVERHGATAVLVARLVPIVPFDPISYVAGLSRLRFARFFWATMAGQIPAGMAYSYLGQEIGRPARLVVAGISVFLALLVIGFLMRRILLGRARAPS